jgi:hypothetical protein
VTSVIPPSGVPAVPIATASGMTQLVYLGRKPLDPLDEERDRLAFKDRPFEDVFRELCVPGVGANFANNRLSRLLKFISKLFSKGHKVNPPIDGTPCQGIIASMQSTSRQRRPDHHSHMRPQIAPRPERIYRRPRDREDTLE